MFNKRGSIILILILFIGISNVKALTSDNITYENEGVTESLTSAIDKLYSELKEYKTNGSVTSTEMLEGYTGYAKGKLVSGSIKKKGSTTYTPGVNNQIINRGQYLDEDQVIIGDKDLVAENIKSGVELFGVNGTYTSDANAVSNQILSGKTAYVNGNKITGNMANKAGATVTASTTTSDATYTYLTIPQAGYYDTTSKVKVENSKIGSSSDSNIINLGQITTYDVKLKYPSVYSKLTNDNFIIKITGGSAGVSYNVSSGAIYNPPATSSISVGSVSYNASTGKLTVTAPSMSITIRGCSTCAGTSASSSPTYNVIMIV